MQGDRSGRSRPQGCQTPNEGSDLSILGWASLFERAIVGLTAFADLPTRFC
jgi:hypothetical protein